MPDLLLYGDTDRNSALRHEIPIAILDPFLYAEVGGEPHIMCHALERERLAAAVPGARLIDVAELGFYELPILERPGDPAPQARGPKTPVALPTGARPRYWGV